VPSINLTETGLSIKAVHYVIDTLLVLIDMKLAMALNNFKHDSVWGGYLLFDAQAFTLIFKNSWLRLVQFGFLMLCYFK
jgi:hypothetical protein